MEATSQSTVGKRESKQSGAGETEEAEDGDNKLEVVPMEDVKEDDYKLTTTLVMSIVISCLGNSFLFGYNIGVINQPQSLCKEFFDVVFYGRNGGNSDDLAKFFEVKAALQESDETTSDALREQEKLIDQEKLMAPGLKTFLWSFTVAIFVATGFIGAVGSAKVADSFGRKKGMIVITPIVFIAGALGGIPTLVMSPECLIAHRFFVGLQSGLSISICPMYLAEISPQKIRGAIGTCNQLAITMGILVSQILGLREILGSADLWPILFALVALPAAIELICLPMMPESPRYLLIKKQDEKAARDALIKFRGHDRVSAEIEAMKAEASKSHGVENYTIVELLKDKSLRKSTIIACTLMICQQWSGINAVMSYSAMLFELVSIKSSTIPYVVAGIGALNCFITLPAIPLMEKLGRWILLFYPTILMLVAFILMMLFLSLQQMESMKEHGAVLGVMCIAMIALYILGFAVGFGPIPFLIVSEIFRQEPRAAAMSLCTACNWTANFILMLLFPYMQEALKVFVFLPFCVVIVVALVFIWFVVPETKNKTIDEIADTLAGK